MFICPIGWVCRWRFEFGVAKGSLYIGIGYETHIELALRELIAISP